MVKLCINQLLILLALHQTILASASTDNLLNDGTQERYCIKSGSIVEDEIQSDDDQTKKLCKSHCFTLWQEDPTNGNITILGQGIILYLSSNLTVMSLNIF